MSASSLYLANARTWVTQFPPVEWALRRAREVAIGALRQGPIPEHVAFVMDGNRRFARSRRIETIEGHNLGFEALARILEVCYRSGVQVVTIYAFSIENFQRSKHEVEGLMGLAKLKLTQLAAHGELLARYGARIKIIGQRELIRPDVLEVVDRVEALTADNGDAILNVCFPYTSREEITSAVRSVVTQWSTPSPEKPRPFSASHISHHIRSRNLAASAPAGASEANASTIGASTSTSTYASTAIGVSTTSTATTISPSSSSSSSPPLPSDDDNAPTTNITAAPSNGPPFLSDRNANADADADADSSSSSLSASTTLHNPSSPSPPPLSAHDAASSSAAAPPPPSSTSASTTTTYPDSETIDVAALNAAMHTAGMPPLRLLVRTSGVARFSDFMLWQAHEATEVAFVPCMWPEFDLWRFLPILVEWQWRQRREGREEGRKQRRKRAASNKMHADMEESTALASTRDGGEKEGKMA